MSDEHQTGTGVIMRPTHADLTRFVNDNHSAASRIGFSVLALKEIWAMATGVRFSCSEDDNCRLGNSYFYEFHSVGTILRSLSGGFESVLLFRVCLSRGWVG